MYLEAKKKLVDTKRSKNQRVAQKLSRNILQESLAKLWQSMPNHLPLKVVQIRRKYGEDLRLKLLRRECLGQKRALR